MEVAYDITVGARALSSARGGDTQLVSLDCRLTMNEVGSRSLLHIGRALDQPPSLGETVRIALDAGGGQHPVFRGEVDRVEPHFDRVSVVASDGLGRLGRLELEESYEEVSAGAIVRDILGHAKIPPGTIVDGPHCPRYVLHRPPRALGHLRALADFCGADFYVDTEGRLQFVAPEKITRQHTLAYGRDVLSLTISSSPRSQDSVEVWGEGAASTQGADKAHWIASDLASVSAKATIDPTGRVIAGGSGGPGLRFESYGAIRSGADAATVAEGKLRRLALRPFRGHVVILGDPAIRLGDGVAFENLAGKQDAHESLLRGRVLRVRAVRHRLSVQEGFTTRLEF